MNIRSLWKASLAALLLAVPAAVGAVDLYPQILCTGLFGCNTNTWQAENILVQSTLPTVGMVLIQLAAGGTVLAIVIAGVQMVTSYGDDGKITSARKAILYALGGLALAFAATPIVSFVSTEDFSTGFQGGIAGVMATIIRIIMVLFNVAFALVVILAGLRMITSQGNADEYKKGFNVIKWAIIGGLVVNLARATVQALLVINL